MVFIISTFMFVLVAQSCPTPTVCNPMGCSLQGSSLSINSPGKTTGRVAISSSRGIFPTQGSNPGLLHCRQILYHLSPERNPNKLYVYHWLRQTWLETERNGVELEVKLFSNHKSLFVSVSLSFLTVWLNPSEHPFLHKASHDWMR